MCKLWNYNYVDTSEIIFHQKALFPVTISKSWKRHNIINAKLIKMLQTVNVTMHTKAIQGHEKNPTQHTGVWTFGNYNGRIIVQGGLRLGE